MNRQIWGETIHDFNTRWMNPLVR